MRLSASLPLPGPFRLHLGSIGGGSRRRHRQSDSILFECLGFLIFCGIVAACAIVICTGFALYHFARWAYAKHLARRTVRP